jgi:hypothetical protein
MISQASSWECLCLRCFFIPSFGYSSLYKDQTKAFLSLTIDLQSLCVIRIRASQMTWTVSNLWGSIVWKIRTRLLSLCRALLSRFPALACLLGHSATFVFPSRISQAGLGLAEVIGSGQEDS